MGEGGWIAPGAGASSLPDASQAEQELPLASDAPEGPQEANLGDKAIDKGKGTGKAAKTPESAAAVAQGPDFKLVPVEGAIADAAGMMQRFTALIGNIPVATVFQDLQRGWFCDGPSAECQIAECEHVRRAKELSNV